MERRLQSRQPAQRSRHSAAAIFANSALLECNGTGRCATLRAPRRPVAPPSQQGSNEDEDFLVGVMRQGAQVTGPDSSLQQCRKPKRGKLEVFVCWLL